MNKAVLLSRHQYAGQNCDMKIANRYFENMAQVRYLGTTIINQNLIHEENKRRLNSGSPYYHLSRTFFSFHLLSKT
jgi:hypothetical protein